MKPVHIFILISTIMFSCTKDEVAGITADQMVEEEATTRAAPSVNVIQQRLKLSGQRWSIPGANAIANLRCYKQSKLGV